MTARMRSMRDDEDAANPAVVTATVRGLAGRCIVRGFHGAWRMLALVAILVLAACAQPVPREKRDYVGEWRGDGMQLAILQEGRVVYRRQRNGGRTSIDAPIKAYEGDDFIVGVMNVETRFVVNVPPRQVDGAWTMTVDGVVLKKVR